MSEMNWNYPEIYEYLVSQQKEKEFLKTDKRMVQIMKYKFSMKKNFPKIVEIMKYTLYTEKRYHSIYKVFDRNEIKLFNR